MGVSDSSAASGSSSLDTIQAAIANPFTQNVPTDKEMPQDFPGGFQITEYINGIAQKGVPGMDLALVGNMMPMQPFPWEREQKIVKEYYPGNPEASVQIMGGQQPPLVIKGRFKDKRYKTANYYGVSYIMSQALDEMCDRGNLLRFGFSGQKGSWWRFGFLEKNSWKLNKLSWIDYEITFQIISDQQPVNGKFAADEKQVPGQLNTTLISQAAAFQASYSAIPKTMPQSIAGLLNNIIGGVAKNIALVTNFVQTVISTASDIEASANRALGLIKNAQANISSFSRQINGLSNSFANYSSSGGSVSQAASFYTNIQYILEAQAGTVTLAQMLAQLEATFKNLSLSVPKARYKVKQGDTLQNISIRFYGVQDYWTNIYDHNKLESTVLVNGTILEIPNL
jgi:LysM repeat protein